MFLLFTLSQRESPELNRLLDAILSAEEAGRTRYTAHVIDSFSGHFLKPIVPGDLRSRLIRLILVRTSNVGGLSEVDQLMYHQILQKLWPEIEANHSGMIGEAGSALALLASRLPDRTREGIERNIRIENSPDKLAATIAEAEKAEEDLAKFILYRRAARLAMEQKRFTYAADLVEKSHEIDSASKATQQEKESRQKTHDEFCQQLVTKSLQANEPDAANYSVRKIKDPIRRAEALRRISVHYLAANDLDNGREAHDAAVKLITKSENTPDSIGVLTCMLTSVHKIDSSRSNELAELTARKLNTFPTPVPDEKPAARLYREHVVKLIRTMNELREALHELIKKNRAYAEEFAGKMNKREFKLTSRSHRLDQCHRPVAREPVAEAKYRTNAELIRSRCKKQTRKSPLKFERAFPN